MRTRAPCLWRCAPLCLITACVLVACGTSHRSSTATGPTFPNTPAGVQARWVVQAVNRLPVTDVALRAHISPAFLRNTTAAEENASLAPYGQVRLVSVARSQARTIVFVMSVRGAQRFLMRLRVDSHGLIAGLDTLREIPPTASPASTIPPLAAGWVAQPVTSGSAAGAWPRLPHRRRHRERRAADERQGGCVFPADPWAFRVEMPDYGIDLRVAFSQSPGSGPTRTRMLTDMFSFQKRPDARNPRRLAGGALLAGAAAIAVRRHRSRARRSR